MQISALSDVGRHRSNNEDAIVIDVGYGMALLADGMGGYKAGEVASALTVEIVYTALTSWLAQAPRPIAPRDMRRALDTCVDKANRVVFDAARTLEECAGMGTTLVMACALENTLYVGHVGDSRAYRWREGTLEQITHDHSLLQEQIDAGLITPEAAAASSHRNLVTRALGVEDMVLMDLQEFTMQPGDVYLLCSDGLSDMVQAGEIAAVLERRNTLEAQCRQLVRLANQHGGRDNISVALMRAGAPEKKERPLQRLLRK